MQENNIIEGPKVDHALEGISLGDATLNVLKSQNNKVAQIDPIINQELRTNLILNRAIAIARWFDSIGLQVGDAVSICSENRLEFVSVPVATFFNGISFAPINPEYNSRELQHCIDLSKPKVIFCSVSSLKKILDLSQTNQFIKHIVLFDKEKTRQKNITYFTDITKGANDGKADDSFKCKTFDTKETVATILCSSGTTGLPKGVLCTHYNMLVWTIISKEFISHNDDINNEETTIGVIPFFHSMGFMFMFLSLLKGTKFIVLKKFNPKLYLECIQKYKVTSLSMPPPIVLFLNKSSLAKKYDLSSVKSIICGAAPLSKELEIMTTKRYKLDHFAQAYGLTETTLGVLMNPVGNKKVGSVGRVLPGMQAKVIDESGKALGPRQEGELCFKGPIIMKGYIGDPESTHTMLDKDGWLHSGDIGYYDEDGYFFIVDRVKELIKYKGFQVAPAELEALLLTHPAITDAAVVGLPNEEAGELPVAFVTKRKNAKVTAKEIENFVADKVSNYKKLRGGVYFIDQIPRNPSGKILRRLLRERLKNFPSKL
ncbi:4-coumarate--CoA ligase 1 [Agrilus planipennis]|uniref:4-coumarate--CoA ligase 1 n=1 Tax=Agrilus planipennis TaxID=224129 RepID=A0A1W4WHZ8_AGRPL|nr:4-coumarate--CoA ligase 1 [Agrilus planipennis]